MASRSIYLGFKNSHSRFANDDGRFLATGHCFSAIVMRQMMNRQLRCWLIYPFLAFVALLFYVPLLKNVILNSTTQLLHPEELTPRPSTEKPAEKKKDVAGFESFLKPHPHAGARHSNGTLGFVADPTALRRGVEDFLLRGNNQGRTINDTTYWNLLQNYQTDIRNTTETKREILSAEYVCAMGPGRGFEKDGGYKLLMEKIQIWKEAIHNDDSARRLRIFCGIYTYPRMHDLLRTTALSWGYKCDGFLAFSTETVPALGLVNLLHEGEESYNNMWQKSRSIWSYIYNNYEKDYDFFHLGGDDLYMIVENFRYFLAGITARQANVTDPLFLGEWARDKASSYMVTGRPGYTLNRAALKMIVNEGFPRCSPHAKVSHEDRMISNCFRDLSIVGGDTRDIETGEQQYHGVDPNTLFTVHSGGGHKSFYGKQVAYWEKLKHPNHKVNGPVGPKPELQAAATYSVSLHDLYHPLYVARIHSLLFKKTCPATTTLGRALRMHALVDDDI